MTLSKLIANQLSHPGSLASRFAGWMWNWRNAALNDRVLHLLTLQPNDRVLDIGFGGGYLLRRMSETVNAGLLAGVDVSPAMVKIALKRLCDVDRAGILDLRCAAAETLPFSDRYFNKVCSVNSIFYWQDAEKGLREIRRVLADGGLLVLCFTDKASIEKKSFAHNIRVFSGAEMEEMMARAGFTEVKTAVFTDPYRTYLCLTGLSQTAA